jgi:cobalamin biosynthesis protein CbiG
LSGRLSVGIGCRRGAAAEEIGALVRATLAECEGRATHIFTLDEKAAHENLRQAALLLSMPLVGLPASALQDESARLSQRSDAAERRFGLPSIAEAAAMAGAGKGARLVALKKSASVVCAVADAGPP